MRVPTRRRENFGSTDQSRNLSILFEVARSSISGAIEKAERFDNIILSCVRKRTDYE